MSVRLTKSTSGEKSAEQQLRFTTVRTTGRPVRDVTG